MKIVESAVAFIEKGKTYFQSTDDRIAASREVKGLILGVNEIYKETKDPELMEIMKRLTEMKKKIEKKLKGVPKV